MKEEGTNKIYKQYENWQETKWAYGKEAKIINKILRYLTLVTLFCQQSAAQTVFGDLLHKKIMKRVNLHILNSKFRKIEDKEMKTLQIVLKFYILKPKFCFNFKWCK